MFRSVQFKTEFCTQTQATIVPRVTMTQFLLMILGAGFGAVILKLPGLLLLVPVVLGYIAGYTHNGELVVKRFWAWTMVWGRQLLQRHCTVTLAQQWLQVSQSVKLKRA